MPEIHFDRYYRYAALTELLTAFASEYPQLMRLESIGKSYEGRDIWLAVVTNTATGPDTEKPALWVDGNIHASEVSPGTACLYLINKLLTQYGADTDITRCLDTRVFYVCPRVNPDGAEWALADVPKIIRSSTRPYPFDEEPLPGLERMDVDGDGRMLMMRIEDLNGPWKAHPDDPRLLVRRDPTEIGGTYYRVLPEGRLNGDFDGIHIPMQGIKENLDLNRNFPMGWRQEYQQFGAGPYPTSEPEARALVHFIASHPNLTGAVTFHTYSGVILRPYDDRADTEFPTEDLKIFKRIGDKGTEISGYPNISVFHDFRYDPKDVITGGFDSWAYDHMGLYAWTVEIWSPQRQAGIKEYKFIDWYSDHPVEEDMLMLKWSDEVLGGKGYVTWYPYEHPQLGKVELGGWDMMYAWRNPPPEFLEKEIAPFAEWLIWQALISPKLELFKLEVTPLGGDTYHIRFAVHNTGWLPSYVSKKALEKKVVRNLVFEIDLPDGAKLKTGQRREEVGQLEGRAYTPPALTTWGGMGSTFDRVKIEWVVHAPNGGTAQLIAKHPRAGVVRAEAKLE